MIRLLLVVCLTGFCLQGSDLSAKGKGDAKAALKAARETVDRLGRGGTTVTMKTSAGTITLTLYDDTPLHRDNFLRLAEKKAYEGVLFHRVIAGFMIQAGDPQSKEALSTVTYGNHDDGEPVPAEIREGYFHHRGALAAARTPDEVNPERESSGSQFYIVQGKTFSDSTLNEAEKRLSVPFPPGRRQVYETWGGAPHLDRSYTIFGRVIKGMKTVDRIAAYRTDPHDRPLKDVFIRKVNVKVKKQKK